MRFILNVFCLLVWIGVFVLHAFTNFAVHSWVVGFAMLIVVFLYAEKVVDDL